MDSGTTSLNDEQSRAIRYDLVSRLADDLAHEIRNPLNAIVINLEVLRGRVQRGDTAAALERIAVVEQETRRLHLIVDRLLQLLRPERDDGAPLALDQAFDELIPLIDARARVARNEFTSECNAPVFIAVPRDAFRFAMLGLLGAVHALLGENGGTLSLRCTPGRDDVRLAIRAIAGARGARVPATDAAYDEAVAAAADLLRGAGGRLEPRRDGVDVVLRRA